MPNRTLRVNYLNIALKHIDMNDKDIMELKKPIIDACINSAKKRGWSDAMGLLRGVLFLESEPMSLDMLAEKTGYSKTTVRLNMNYLENMGFAVRVVGQLGKQGRYKQHRYALVKDVEVMKQEILSAAIEETGSILQAINQVEKNLKDISIEDAKIASEIAKSRQFYEDMNKILGFLSGYSLKELVEAIESKKK